MTWPSDTSWEDVVKGMAKKREPQVRALPQIRGKQFDGELYVKAEDIADCLEQLAPVANKRLIDKLRLAGKRA